eukprot:c26491_g1_i1 orf=480-674(-)
MKSQILFPIQTARHMRTVAPPALNSPSSLNSQLFKRAFQQFTRQPSRLNTKSTIRIHLSLGYSS